MCLNCKKTVKFNGADFINNDNTLSLVVEINRLIKSNCS